MSTKKKSESVEPKTEKKFKTEKLIKSRHFAGYQQDFARAILSEPEYTVSGAKKILDEALKGGN